MKRNIRISKLEVKSFLTTLDSMEAKTLNGGLVTRACKESFDLKYCVKTPNTNAPTLGIGIPCRPTGLDCVR